MGSLAFPSRPVNENASFYLLQLLEEMEERLLSGFLSDGLFQPPLPMAGFVTTNFSFQASPPLLFYLPSPPTRFQDPVLLLSILPSSFARNCHTDQ